MKKLFILVGFLVFSCSYSGKLSFSPKAGEQLVYQSEYVAIVIERRGFVVKHYDYVYRINAVYTVDEVYPERIDMSVRFKELYVGPGEQLMLNFKEFAGESADYNPDLTRNRLNSLVNFSQKYKFSIKDGDIIWGVDFFSLFKAFDEGYFQIYQGLASQGRLFDLESGLQRLFKSTFAFYSKSSSANQWDSDVRVLTSGEYYPSFHEIYSAKKSFFSDNVTIVVEPGHSSSIKNQFVEQGETLSIGYSFNGEFSVDGKIVVNPENGVLLSREQENKVDGRIKFFSFFDRNNSWSSPILIKEKISIKQSK
ncbi:MAG: hypothetical protein JXR63_01720 [Spirochaetales bacterium]|nr:hypothetical protein [Spirochaetales bacterium]